MRKVIDTRKNLDPMTMLATAVALGASGAIEQQEREGQDSFVQSDTLPTKGNLQHQRTLEAWGFKFLGAVPGDDLFQYVTLPTGWQKRGSDHDMWSYIVDDEGVDKVSVFYKAAFYDRDAFYRLS